MKRQLTEFGMQVRIELVKRNMTQVELADLLGIKKQYLYKILTGERSGERYVEDIKRILELDGKAA